MALQESEDIEAVKLACDGIAEYASFFEQSTQSGATKSLEDQFFEREAQLNKLAFLQQVCLQETQWTDNSFTSVLFMHI